MIVFGQILSAHVRTDTALWSKVKLAYIWMFGTRIKIVVIDLLCCHSPVSASSTHSEIDVVKNLHYTQLVMITCWSGTNANIKEQIYPFFKKKQKKQ